MKLPVQSIYRAQADLAQGEDVPVLAVSYLAGGNRGAAAI
jgi:hypothetical protein